MENVKDTLRAFVMQYADIPEDDPDFNDDTDLFDYGYVDSLGATEILLYLEDAFRIAVTQEDITLYPMNTVNEIAEVAERKVHNG